MCAGGEGTSACTGDSGGPLTCLDASGVWVLEGITSFGRQDCFPYQASVFTRVSSFVDWMDSIIAGNILELMFKLKTSVMRLLVGQYFSIHLRMSD